MLWGNSRTRNISQVTHQQISLPLADRGHLQQSPPLARQQQGCSSAGSQPIFQAPDFHFCSQVKNSSEKCWKMQSLHEPQR